MRTGCTSIGHVMTTEMHKLFADDDLEIVQNAKRYILPSILASNALSNHVEEPNLAAEHAINSEGPIDSPKSSTVDLYMYLVFNKRPILS